MGNSRTLHAIVRQGQNEEIFAQRLAIFVYLSTKLIYWSKKNTIITNIYVNFNIGIVPE